MHFSHKLLLDDKLVHDIFLQFLCKIPLPPANVYEEMLSALSSIKLMYWNSNTAIFAQGARESSMAESPKSHGFTCTQPAHALNLQCCSALECCMGRDTQSFIKDVQSSNVK